MTQTEMEIDERLVVLGALTHDIGKLAERAGLALPDELSGRVEQARFAHEPFSLWFVDELIAGGADWGVDGEEWRRLVSRHHAAERADEMLLRIAERLSVDEPAEEAGDAEAARGRPEVRLRRAAAALREETGRKDAAICHPLAKLSLAKSFLLPETTKPGTAADYDRLWRGLLDAARSVRPGDIGGLLAVLKSFTWAAPSNAGAEDFSDVSLYEHLKSSAAIAACLSRALRDQEQIVELDAALTRLRLGELTEADEKALAQPLCALIKGDISGTQDFLYLLTSDGAARGLRGRSFYLQLLTETVARWMLGQCGLEATNLLYAGGGHFYLLAPLAEVERNWADWQAKIARRMWRAHHGDLGLALGYVKVSARDFVASGNGSEGFAAKWAEVSQRTNESKQRKWMELDGAEMFNAIFTARQMGTVETEMCQVCHGEWIPKPEFVAGETRKCGRCESFENLGRQLRDAQRLVTFTVPEFDAPGIWDWEATLRSFGVAAHLMRSEPELPFTPPGATAVNVDLLNDTNLPGETGDWGGLPVSFGFRLLADATPIKPGRDGDAEIAEFSDLAEASEGVKWLGVLRMDVDDLGEVFRTKLGAQASIARVSTLSESLRLFFEGHAPRLCQRHNQLSRERKERPDKVESSRKRDKVCLIYAGGDDLFVVGAWSVLPMLAKEIRDDFRRFVGGDHLTLSGGVAIEHQKYPLYQLADDARRALDDQAKAFRPQKDAICFLQKSMGWDQFEKVDVWRGELRRMLGGKNDEGRVARGLLSRLIEIHALYQENARRQMTMERAGRIALGQIAEKIHYSRWQWRLVYQLKRFGERHKEHQKKLDEFQRAITREQEGLIPLLRVIARWTELQTRED